MPPQSHQAHQQALHGSFQGLVTESSVSPQQDEQHAAAATSALNPPEYLQLPPQQQQQSWSHADAVAWPSMHDSAPGAADAAVPAAVSAHAEFQDIPSDWTVQIQSETTIPFPAAEPVIGTSSTDHSQRVASSHHSTELCMQPQGSTHPELPHGSSAPAHAQEAQHSQTCLSSSSAAELTASNPKHQHTQLDELSHRLSPATGLAEYRTYDRAQSNNSAATLPESSAAGADLERTFNQAHSNRSAATMPEAVQQLLDCVPGLRGMVQQAVTTLNRQHSGLTGGPAAASPDQELPAQLHSLLGQQDSVLQAVELGPSCGMQDPAQDHSFPAQQHQNGPEQTISSAESCLTHCLALQSPTGMEPPAGSEGLLQPALSGQLLHHRHVDAEQEQPSRPLNTGAEQMRHASGQSFGPMLLDRLFGGTFPTERGVPADRLSAEEIAGLKFTHQQAPCMPSQSHADCLDPATLEGQLHRAESSCQDPVQLPSGMQLGGRGVVDQEAVPGVPSMSQIPGDGTTLQSSSLALPGTLPDSVNGSAMTDESSDNFRAGDAESDMQQSQQQQQQQQALGDRGNALCYSQVASPAPLQRVRPMASQQHGQQSGSFQELLDQLARLVDGYRQPRSASISSSDSLPPGLAASQSAAPAASHAAAQGPLSSRNHVVTHGQPCSGDDTVPHGHPYSENAGAAASSAPRDDFPGQPAEALANGQRVTVMAENKLRAASDGVPDSQHHEDMSSPEASCSPSGARKPVPPSKAALEKRSANEDAVCPFICRLITHNTC